ncbi:MAG: 3-keto-disaccharide hydrolase [Flavisolibacter sp.]
MIMKPYHLLLLSALALSSTRCSGPHKAQAGTPASVNPQGYQALFDGKTLQGWRTYRHKENDTWTVVDGTLYGRGKTAKGQSRADLITTGEYQNFDLSLDWKISPQGNSGILYLVTEAYPESYLSGPEYQIIDDAHFPEHLEDWQKTGANYAMDPAPEAAPHPVGEWNHTRILVNKGHVEHWLNGKKIVDYQIGSPEWKAKKAAGKWKDAEGYGQATRGHIALQDHGSEVWFKNILIREL